MTIAEVHNAGYALLSADASNGDEFGTNEENLAARVVSLLAAFPGIKTLSALVAIDPGDLNPSARIDYLSALERQSAWLQALMQRQLSPVA